MVRACDRVPRLSRICRSTSLASWRLTSFTPRAVNRTESKALIDVRNAVVRSASHLQQRRLLLVDDNVTSSADVPLTQFDSGKAIIECRVIVITRDVLLGILRSDALMSTQAGGKVRVRTWRVENRVG
jgi:hypothetical protein